MNRFVWAAILLSLLAGPLAAADLARIERTIVKEPAYKSGSVKYCLLVFGPEAKTRVWLALDGDTLYVDRNGNGDLTDAGERVEAKADRYRDQGDLTFEVGDIRDGERLHKKLSILVRQWSDLSAITDQDVLELIASDPKALLLWINIDVEMPPWQGTGPAKPVTWSMTGWDHQGVLKLGGKPQDAPIVHFGGPWHVLLREKHELVIEREGWLVAHVGTPGLGAGTTAYFAYEGVIPEGAHPTAEIVYPPAKAGDPPVRERYELKERC